MKPCSPFYRVAMGGAALLLVLFMGCRTQTEGQEAPSPSPARSTSLLGARVAASPPDQDDGQWLMPAKNYASTRYSGLGQINVQNARNLKVAWTFSTGSTRGHEAAPLVVGSTMYVVGPFPNHLFALDLNNPGSTKWVYKPPVNPAAQGVACCDHVNRGAAWSNGKVFYNTLDGQTVAVDAETGQEIWRTTLGTSTRARP